MKRPRVTCPRCGKRRTMQEALRWRKHMTDEHVPVCNDCWLDLVRANAAYAIAVETPGLVLRVERSEEKR